MLDFSEEVTAHNDVLLEFNLADYYEKFVPRSEFAVWCQAKINK